MPEPAPPSTALPPAPRGAAALLVVAALLPFLPALWGGWVWDDELVHSNPDLHSLAGLWRIWAWPFDNHEAGSRYWPLFYTSFWIDYQLWGSRPMGHHATSLVLHAANTVLLWRVLRLLKAPGALAAALLFAVHPAHVESVAWVTERKTVLGSLLALLCAINHLDERKDGRARRDALATFFFAAACLARPVVLLLPLVLAALAWGRDGRVAWRRLAPMGVLAVAFAALTLLLSALFESKVVTLSAAERVRLAGWTTLQYIRLSFIPLGLSPIHPRPEWVLAGAAGWIPPLLVAALAGGCALLVRRSRWPLAALLVFCLLLAPASGLMPFAFLRHSWIAERFLYLPLAAPVALACAIAARRWARHGKALAATCALLVLLGAASSWEYTHAYRDMTTLFTRALRKVPDSHIAHYNIGVEALSRGELDRAAFHLQEAVRANDQSAEAWANLGVAARRRGDAAVAQAALRRALELDPGRDEALVNLGSMLAEAGQLDEAEALLRRATRARSPSWEAHNEWAILQAQRGDLAGALRSFGRASALAPSMEEPVVNAATTLARLGERERAVAMLDAHLRAFPQSPAAREARDRLAAP